MYMDDIKLFAQNKKKNRKPLIPTVRIYNQDKGMKSDIKNAPC